MSKNIHNKPLPPFLFVKRDEDYEDVERFEVSTERINIVHTNKIVNVGIYILEKVEKIRKSVEVIGEEDV